MDDGYARGFEEAASRARTSPRDSMLLTATLDEGEGDVAPLRVRNLSAGGLMAECDSRLVRGTPVTVHIRGIGDVPGRVAWAEPGRIGVAFDMPVDPRDARRRVTARSTSKRL